MVTYRVLVVGFYNDKSLTIKLNANAQEGYEVKAMNNNFIIMEKRYIDGEA